VRKLKKDDDEEEEGWEKEKITKRGAATGDGGWLRSDFAAAIYPLRLY